MKQILVRNCTNRQIEQILRTTRLPHLYLRRWTNVLPSLSQHRPTLQHTITVNKLLTDQQMTLIDLIVDRVELSPQLLKSEINFGQYYYKYWINCKTNELTYTRYAPTIANR